MFVLCARTVRVSVSGDLKVVATHCGFPLIFVLIEKSTDTPHVDAAYLFP